jgi:hypothetical protein
MQNFHDRRCKLELGQWEIRGVHPGISEFHGTRAGTERSVGRERGRVNNRAIQRNRTRSTQLHSGMGVWDTPSAQDEQQPQPHTDLGAHPMTHTPALSRCPKCMSMRATMERQTRGGLGSWTANTVVHAAVLWAKQSSHELTYTLPPLRQQKDLSDLAMECVGSDPRQRVRQAPSRRWPAGVHPVVPTVSADSE